MGKKMIESIIGIIGTLGGVFLGAILQKWFDSRKEHPSEKHWKLLRKRVDEDPNKRSLLITIKKGGGPISLRESSNGYWAAMNREMLNNRNEIKFYEHYFFTVDRQKNHSVSRTYAFDDIIGFKLERMDKMCQQIENHPFCVLCNKETKESELFYGKCNECRGVVSEQ